MVLAVEIRIDSRNADRALKKLQPNARRRIGQKLKEVAFYVQQKAIQYAYENAKYSRTGKLRAAIQVRDVNTQQMSVRIVADRRIAPYARAVEYGQRPHEIPRNPAWGMIGRTHPGARGKFFMTRAAVDAALVAPRKVREGLRTAIQDSGFRR